MDDRTVLDAFGEAQTLADAIGARGIGLTRSAVYEWRRNGIPARWRGLIADIARERGIPLPADFEPPRAAPMREAG